MVFFSLWFLVFCRVERSDEWFTGRVGSTHHRHSILNETLRVSSTRTGGIKLAIAAGPNYLHVCSCRHPLTHSLVAVAETSSRADSKRYPVSLHAATALSEVLKSNWLVRKRWTNFRTPLTLFFPSFRIFSYAKSTPTHFPVPSNWTSINYDSPNCAMNFPSNSMKWNATWSHWMLWMRLPNWRRKKMLFCSRFSPTSPNSSIRAIIKAKCWTRCMRGSGRPMKDWLRFVIFIFFQCFNAFFHSPHFFHCHQLNCFD